MYYKCIKLYTDTTKIDYWYTSAITKIMKAYDFIIPVGTRKPRNITKEQIRYDI